MKKFIVGLIFSLIIVLIVILSTVSLNKPLERDQLLKSDEETDVVLTIEDFEIELD